MIRVISKIRSLSYSLVFDADNGEAQLTICGAGTQAGYGQVVAVMSGVDDFSKIVFNDRVNNTDLESKYIEIAREWTRQYAQTTGNDVAEMKVNERKIARAVAKHWRS